LIAYDGHPDGVEVFLSNGDGTFASGVFYSVPGVSSNGGIVAADFTGDGIPDVLIPSYDSSAQANTVALFKGKGDGTLSALPTTSPIGGGIINVGALLGADMNGDGKLDFTFSGQSSNGMALNGGGGTFGGPATMTGVGEGQLGDLDGDGAAEVIGFANPAPGPGLCVFKNSGSGQLAAPVCYPDALAGNSGVWNEMALGDVNGDGKLDAIALNDSVDTDANIAVYIGKGDGTFADRVLATLPGKRVSGVTLGDVNNDGKADLVAFADGAASGLVEVMLSKGDGTFAAPAEYPAGATQTGGGGERPVIADFMGNGLRGIAVENHSKEGIDVIIATCKP
jgi:FG-GAP-like repeat